MVWSLLSIYSPAQFLENTGFLLNTGLTMNTFDEFADSLSPHPSKAQIILELGHSEGTFKRALHILQGDEGDIEYEFVHRKHSSWLHVLIPSNEMQDAVLRLSEAGFTQVRGISAQKHRFLDEH